MNSSKYSSTSIQLANDARKCKQSGASIHGGYSFPAPVNAKGAQKHGVASTLGYPGLWAYTSNNAIVVVKSADLPRIWPLFTMLDGSGWDTYLSVSFCQSVPEKWPIPDSPLVAASKGGLVRVFNIENNATVKFHTCHSGHRAIAEWSPRNSRLIFGSDDAGQLSIWDVVENSCVLLSFDNLQTTCMAVSPHEDDIVALGDKDGSIRILNTTGTGSVLQTMKHSEEIYSLTWKPAGKWAYVTKLRKQIEPFLATSYTSIQPPCVEVCDREGKFIINLSHDASDPTPRKLILRSIPSIWVHLPSDPQVPETRLAMMSVGPDGKILSWNELDSIPVVVHDLNKDREVFALVQSGDILWSLSREPYIIGWNLRTSKVEAIIPTYAGICSISVSTIEQTRFAIGGKDSYIRVIKVEPDYPNGKFPEMPLLPTKVLGKVTAVAWHPWLDKVGFGTDGGYLGIYDIKAESRYVMEFAKQVTGTVYTVDWGPKCYSPDYKPKERPTKPGEEDSDRKGDSLWLYACGNRAAFCIHPGRRDNALLNVTRIIGVSNEREERRVAGCISDIKWSPDRLYLAAGYTDGKIEIYIAPHLKIRCWIKCHSTSIQFLSWRSLDFVDDESGKKDKYFASAANDGTAKVYNLSGLYDPEFLANGNAPVLRFISSHAILNGHRGLRVIQVVWSPHDDNHILTISYDRTAVIWDLRDKSKVARYMGHDHRLVACAFHPTNSYVVITCSDEMVTDSCFHMWDYRLHPEVGNYQQKMALESMSGAKAECVKALAAPLPKVMFRPGCEDAAVGMDKKEKVPVRQDANARLMSKIRDRMTLLPLTCHHKVQNTLLQSIMNFVDGVPLPDPSTLTPYELSLIEEETKTPKLLGKVEALVEQMEKKKVSNDLDDLPKGFELALYGSREDLDNLVRVEMDTHIKHEDWTSAICLLGCIPNPQPYIEKILAAGHIEESLVICSQRCPRRFHRACCERYAAHLIQTGKLSEGISYYWDVLESFDDAYNEMVKHDMLFDALAFSKLNRINGKWEQTRSWSKSSQSETSLRPSLRISISQRSETSGVSVYTPPPTEDRLTLPQSEEMDGNLNDEAMAPRGHAITPDSQADVCCHCNGYYGPSNGDPLCGICHDFLYVEHFYISHSQQNWGYSSMSQTQTTEKDDGDSGNDEPSEDAPPIPLMNSQPPISLLQQAEDSDGVILPTARSNSDDAPAVSDILNLPQHSSFSGIPQPAMAPENIPRSSDPSPEEAYNIPAQPTEVAREYERITRRLALLTAPIPSYKMVPEVDLTTRLPPEIWRMVFQKLDPVSLLLSSRVRLLWKSIIREMVSNELWKSFVMEKWPLFNPIYEVRDWYSVFVTFLESLSCCSCWTKMSGGSAFLPAPTDNGMAVRSLRSVRLSKELKWLRSDHPDGIEAVPLDYLNYNWLARITGPPQSPYQGGVFYLNIKIPHDYPLKPPLVRFLTKVYHPNISRHGDIGIDCIQHNWTLALFIPQTLLSIQSLLTDPCTESASMEPSISYHYVNDRKGFERQARMWTWKYAMIDVLLT